MVVVLLEEVLLLELMVVVQVLHLEVQLQIMELLTQVAVEEEVVTQDLAGHQVMEEMVEKELLY